MSGTAISLDAEEAQAASFANRLTATLSMIKVAHTIFAMPFALIGWAIGVATVNEADAYFDSVDPTLTHDFGAAGLPQVAQNLGFGNWPWAWTLIWVVVAMVAARSFAMTFNRIADVRIDGLNPRTAQRELPRGVLSSGFAWGFAITAALLFGAACLMLNLRTLVLAPVALAIIAGYSYTKRFTSLCHIVLGLGLALAPIGAWLAVTGGPMDAILGERFAPFGFRMDTYSRVTEAPAALVYPGVLAFSSSAALFGLGVIFWVAGFDVLYSLQDEEFDKGQGLHSIPATLGRRGALWVSRIMHLCAIAAWVCAVLYFNSASQQVVLPELASSSGSSEYWESVLGGLPRSHDMGILTWIAIGIAAVCLAYEQSIVKVHDISRVNAAFFTVNGAISIAMAILIVVDIFLV